MAIIRRRRGTAMQSDEPNQNRNIENMKALMMQLACSDLSKLPYKDLIEEKIQKLMMRSLPDHPTYAAMIDGALYQLKEEEGSTEEAISSFIAECYDDLPLAHATFLKHHLKQLVEKEEIACTSGNRYVHMGSTTRTEITESPDPKTTQQLEETECQKQVIGKGSGEADKENRGEEQPIQEIDDRTDERPVLIEECNEELREHADMIMGQTDDGKRMADESTNEKGQHNNGVNLGLENPTEAIVAIQEVSRLTYETAEMQPLGEEQIQASDEQHHPEQQVDDVGYINRLEEFKRLREQQNHFCDKITELYTMVENLKKFKKDGNPRTISSSSALTDLRLNQPFSLLFSHEEGLPLMSKLTGASHHLAEMLNSSTLMEASKLGWESVVVGQQRDGSAKNSLPTPAPCQGRKCNHTCGCKPQDKQNQKRSYCRSGATKSGMKTMSPDIDVDSLQLQDKSLSQVSHSERHSDSEGTLMKSFKRRKKTKFSPEVLEETSMGRSDHVKLVEQLEAGAVEPSTPGIPQPEEHLKDTETTEQVKCRMQKKISGEAKEPATTIVLEQLHQRQGKRQLTIPYSRGKRGPDSAGEDDSCLADFFPPKKRAKKGTKMKLKQLDKEQQEQVVMIGTMQSAGVSSPENPVEQNNVQHRINTVPHEEIQEPGSPPTNQKRRGRPPGTGKGPKLKKEMQQQQPRKRGRPCKVKTGIEITGKLRHGKKERRGRPRKIKVPTDTSTDELSSQDKNQPEESEPQGNECP